jgi:RNase H-fold protein (predicted Holliday junction resolvase)
MTILGISIGTTQTGVCVLKKGVLLDWQIHAFKHAWSKHKLHRIIQQYRRYIVKHNVNAIMVKVPQLTKDSKELASIRTKLVILAKEHNCAIDFILKSEIKERLTLQNTTEIVELARREYPVLEPVYKKGVHNKHSYYQKLYEAVLGAHLYTILHPTTK